MSENQTLGIRVDDAALEVEAAALPALLAGELAEVTLTRLDATASSSALNDLLARLRDPISPPRVEVEPGSLLYEGAAGGTRFRIRVAAPGLAAEFTGEGLRLHTVTDAP